MVDTITCNIWMKGTHHLATSLRGLVNLSVFCSRPNKPAPKVLCISYWVGGLRLMVSQSNPTPLVVMLPASMPSSQPFPFKLTVGEVEWVWQVGVAWLVQVVPQLHCLVVTAQEVILMMLTTPSQDTGNSSGRNSCKNVSLCVILFEFGGACSIIYHSIYTLCSVWDLIHVIRFEKKVGPFLLW